MSNRERKKLDKKRTERIENGDFMLHLPRNTGKGLMGQIGQHHIYMYNAFTASKVAEYLKHVNPHYNTEPKEFTVEIVKTVGEKKPGLLETYGSKKVLNSKYPLKFEECFYVQDPTKVFTYDAP